MDLHSIRPLILSGLLGVSCFDLNVMMDPATMKSQSYWDDFVA